jgi:hypothetical protein
MERTIYGNVEHQDHRRDQRHVYQEDGFAVAAAAAAAVAAVPEIGADISDTRLLALPCLRK